MSHSENPPILTHLDASGRAQMVDVSSKAITTRIATARGRVILASETVQRLRTRGVEKGDVFAVARIAAVLAAKQTSLLIPLCHGLPLSCIEVRFAYLNDPIAILIEATCTTSAQTGVEMEAIIAVQVGAATIYDMLKGIDKYIVISDVHLREKQGGRSGHFSNHLSIPGTEQKLEWF